MNTIENTPKHCWDCWKFQKCNQAQNMNAYTRPVEAYMGNAEFLCGDCAVKFMAVNGKLEHIGDTGETDCPDHCASCGVPLECSLTTDGVEYLKEQLAGGGGCCQELWPVLYACYL